MCGESDFIPAMLRVASSQWLPGLLPALIVRLYLRSGLNGLYYDASQALLVHPTRWPGPCRSSASEVANRGHQARAPMLSLDMGKAWA
jgi:hypothetical protein